MKSMGRLMSSLFSEPFIYRPNVIQLCTYWTAIAYTVISTYYITVCKFVQVNIWLLIVGRKKVL